MAEPFETLHRRPARPSWKESLFVWASAAAFLGLSAMAAASLWAAYG